MAGLTARSTLPPGRRAPSRRRPAFPRRPAVALAIFLGFLVLRQTLAGYIALPPTALPYRPGTVIPDGRTGSFMWVVSRHLWISVYWPSWLAVSLEAMLLAIALAAVRAAPRFVAARLVIGLVALITAFTAIGCCGVVLAAYLLATLYRHLAPLAPWANAALVAASLSLVLYGRQHQGAPSR